MWLTAVYVIGNNCASILITSEIIELVSQYSKVSGNRYALSALIHPHF